MMVDKRAEIRESWVVDKVIGVAIEHIDSNYESHDELDRHVKVERLSDTVLAMSVHQSQLWRVMNTLQSNGIEPYRCVDNDTCAGEYELLYLTSDNALLDLVRYQKILDNAA